MASVVNGALLEEYVALGDQELPPVRCAAITDLMPSFYVALV